MDVGSPTRIVLRSIGAQRKDQVPVCDLEFYILSSRKKRFYHYTCHANLSSALPPTPFMPRGPTTPHACTFFRLWFTAKHQSSDPARGLRGCNLVESGTGSKFDRGSRAGATIARFKCRAPYLTSVPFPPARTLWRYPSEFRNVCVAGRSLDTLLHHSSSISTILRSSSVPRI